MVASLLGFGTILVMLFVEKGGDFTVENFLFAPVSYPNREIQKLPCSSVLQWCHGLYKEIQNDLWCYWRASLLQRRE
jgi:hypothetical protein